MEVFCVMRYHGEDKCEELWSIHHSSLQAYYQAQNNCEVETAILNKPTNGVFPEVIDADNVYGLNELMKPGDFFIQRMEVRE